MAQLCTHVKYTPASLPVDLSEEIAAYNEKAAKHMNTMVCLAGKSKSGVVITV